MPVNRNDVVNAYRLILGREPENEDVILAAMSSPDLANLRSAFLASVEFKRRQGLEVGPPPVGRFLDATSHGTDLDCTRDQMTDMLSRIASAWREFGETEPHWSVLTSDDFKQENLQKNIDAFYLSGVRSVERDFNFLKRADRPLSFKKALDFGCGVGRLTFALTPYAETVVGMDISTPHLRVAREEAQKRSIRNVEFKAMESLNDISALNGFDLIISKIVLQHNPPPIMAAIMERLLQSLASGGVAIIQLPTFLEHQTFAVETYLNNSQPKMEMNALPQRFVFELIEQTGCRCLEVREDTAIGSEPGISQIFCIAKR